MLTKKKKKAFPQLTIQRWGKSALLGKQGAREGQSPPELTCYSGVT